MTVNRSAFICALCLALCIASIIAVLAISLVYLPPNHDLRNYTNFTAVIKRQEIRNALMACKEHGLGGRCRFGGRRSLQRRMKEEVCEPQLTFSSCKLWKDRGCEWKGPENTTSHCTISSAWMDDIFRD